MSQQNSFSFVNYDPNNPNQSVSARGRRRGVSHLTQVVSHSSPERVNSSTLPSNADNDTLLPSENDETSVINENEENLELINSENQEELEEMNSRFRWSRDGVTLFLKIILQTEFHYVQNATRSTRNIHANWTHFCEEEFKKHVEFEPLDMYFKQNVDGVKCQGKYKNLKKLMKIELIRISSGEVSPATLPFWYDDMKKIVINDEKFFPRINTSSTTITHGTTTSATSPNSEHRSNSVLPDSTINIISSVFRDILDVVDKAQEKLINQLTDSAEEHAKKRKREEDEQAEVEEDRRLWRLELQRREVRDRQLLEMQQSLTNSLLEFMASFQPSNVTNTNSRNNTNNDVSEDSSSSNNQ